MSKFNLSLANYLNEIEHQLRDLPAPARADELREIKAHLRALVLAEQQLEDVDEAAATATALRQFGAPRAIGRNLRRAWERKQSEPWQRAALALALAVAMRAIFDITSPALTHLYLAHNGVDLSKSVDMIPNAPALLANLLIYQQIMGVFTATAIGYVVGLISPKRGLAVAWLFTAFTLLQAFTRSFLPLGNSGSPEIATIFAVAATVMLVFVSVGTCLGARQTRRASIRRTNAK